MWIVILVGTSVIAAIFLTSWRRRIRLAELGTVSTQWLAEHRLNEEH